VRLVDSLGLCLVLILEPLSILTASGTVKKVIEINPYLLGTMAGGAGSSLLTPFSQRHTLIQILNSRLSILGNLFGDPVSIA
jgi:hypothetical protein